MSKTALYIQLDKELALYKKMMSEVSQTIIDENVSNFPIMVVHQHEVAIGMPIAERGTVKGNWSINASTLEEFMTKQIIEEQKLDSFKTIYKSSKTHICLFVLSELGAQFIFLKKDA